MYFWRILNGPTDAITYRLLKHRKDNFLGSNKGFAHEVFNICCKYNMLQLWHGNAPDKVNPLHFIKRTIISKNLRTDLETGRTKACCFASIFLSNPFTYQKNYHLVEPFRQPESFASANGRKRFVKALLHPCSYFKACPYCNQQQKDMLDHFLTTCSRLSELRKELYLRLAFYNLPRDRIPLNKNDALNLTLNNRILRNCLLMFLVDTDI